MKYRPPALKTLKDGTRVLQFHIAPEFMRMADRAFKNCDLPQEEFFACMFNRLLEKEMAEFERSERGDTMAIIYRCLQNGPSAD